MPDTTAPKRLDPFLPIDPNEAIVIAKGPFHLIGKSSDAVLESDLVFRWTEAEFAGSYQAVVPTLDGDWLLVCEWDQPFRAPAAVTSLKATSGGWQVRGVTRGFEIGAGPFDLLRFGLANFPDYFGSSVSYGGDGSGGFVGRFECKSDAGSLVVDLIPESKQLAKDDGYFVSHVGQWVPASGRLTPRQAKDTLHMLHLWLGFMRGTWAGPLFPQGISAGSVVWRQIDPWKLREHRHVVSWLPETTPLDVSAAFDGFTKRWKDPAWRQPLINAIGWLVEANAKPIVREVSIVLAQVALELLSWVWVVEQCRMHSRRDFRALSGRRHQAKEERDKKVAEHEYFHKHKH